MKKDVYDVLWNVKESVTQEQPKTALKYQANKWKYCGLLLGQIGAKWPRLNKLSSTLKLNN